METNSDIINEYLIGLYFDLSNDYKTAAIKRAYRDFNRTLQDFPPDLQLRSSFRNNWIEILNDRINIILNEKFKNTEDFTQWHRATCCQLKKVNQYPLTHGQAQKWLNMSLKYLFTMGESRVPGISLNYPLFHIPIDNIILNKLATKVTHKLEVPWSQIQDYDSYYKYQMEIRNSYPNRIPLDVEFELFNQRRIK